MLYRWLVPVNCPCGHSYSAAPGTEIRIERCPRCRTGATLPAPARDIHADGLFTDARAGYGGRRLDNRQQWLYEAQLRLRWMRRRRPAPARLLEIGAATGEFVATAASAGYDVVGLETSPLAAQHATAISDRVWNGDLAGWRVAHPKALFDAVAMFHVLEHMPDPTSFLVELGEVLAPDAWLFMEVPNGGSRLAVKQGVQWWAARPEDHFFHFTSQGMAALLARTGYRPVEIRPLHRDVYARLRRRDRLRSLAKQTARPLFGKTGRSLDLVRVVARPAADG